jgi:hypothetical protein
MAGLCPACLLDAGSVTETRPCVWFEPPRLEVAGLFPNLELTAGCFRAWERFKARQPALGLVALKILPAQL